MHACSYDSTSHLLKLACAARNPLLQHSIGDCGYSDEANNIYLKDFATPGIFMAAPAGRIRLGPETLTILSKPPGKCDGFIFVIEKKYRHGRSKSGYLHQHV